MNNKTYGWALVVLVLVFGVAAIVAYTRNHNRALSISTNELAAYTNETYGYSFFYPPAYTVRVASDDHIIVGIATSSGFTSYAEARVATSTDAPSYAEFVAGVARSLCTVRPGTSCTNIAEMTSYTTETGLAGTKYYFDLTTADGTKQRFGPLYAFNIGGNVTNAQYAALLVYRPFDATGAVETFSAEDIAKTLQITKVQKR
jgi:hypothetical protein